MTPAIVLRCYIQRLHVTVSVIPKECLDGLVPAASHGFFDMTTTKILRPVFVCIMVSVFLYARCTFGPDMILVVKRVRFKWRKMRNFRFFGVV